jgi:FAD/FMN-containing dehydrogenase
MTIQLAGLNGGTLSIAADALQSFKAAFKGQLLTPDDPAYEDTRKVWNAMIDRRPGLIARCTGTADVVQAVRFARQHGVLNSVRGGGHNIAGLAVCEGGLMIDMSLLRGVWVDPTRQVARAQAGCTLGDVDRETQLHGLAAVLGFVSATGIAGLTVGGGFGYLTRCHGWTCDNLASMEVVTAGRRSCAPPRARTPTCSGPCVVAAAISASSPPSNTGSCLSAPRSSAARSRGGARTPGRCSTRSASSVPRRRAS